MQYSTSRAKMTKDLRGDREQPQETVRPGQRVDRSGKYISIRDEHHYCQSASAQALVDILQPADLVLQVEALGDELPAGCSEASDLVAGLKE